MFPFSFTDKSYKRNYKIISTGAGGCNSVADPHYIDADPVPTYHFDVDPDADPDPT
jgi:hypothetical protein